MATYMVQFSYTVDAWQRLVKNPEDRSKALGAALDKLGGRLISLHYCFGEYDGMAILEAPDDVTAGAGVLATLGGGHLKATRTTKLLSIEEAMGMMGKAGDIVYAAPAG